MPKKLYSDIYDTLKDEINKQVYPPRNTLPGEEDLAARFDVTRNTVRRALKELQSDGLVYAVKGRGVVVLEPIRDDKVVFTADNNIGFEGLKKFPQNKFIQELSTEVLSFEEVEVDERIEKITSFNAGDKAFYIERLRLFDGNALVVDNSYFRKSMLKDMTVEDAKSSIYQYIRDNNLFKIAAERSTTTVESATKRDMQVLDIDDMNCVGVLTKFVYTDTGSLFEHTQTRYVPNNFSMVDFKSF
ncbi:GntR family transcriptional regulator [Companilactobacillus allii]|uniref:HTH gntR-type domain-containing protein n=1 Tax=Companilactobacillus allii TaxID=1847728 RepID=A0A1P8Q0A8_9LACO|nr:GntR family transcriptional regulator [Companilactobacillus allii]APX71308.1 hypothetical protein BTM29_01515 [Companilactobacillus allii]USQ68391.1 GntR family transcriptional regulator [Companilactobacillus allii]